MRPFPSVEGYNQTRRIDLQQRARNESFPPHAEYVLRNAKEAFAAAHSALNGQAAPLQVYDGSTGKCGTQRSSLDPVYWPKDPYTGAALCSLSPKDASNAETLHLLESDVAKAAQAMGADLKHFSCSPDGRASELVVRLMAAAPIVAGLADTHPDLLRKAVCINPYAA